MSTIYHQIRYINKGKVAQRLHLMLKIAFANNFVLINIQIFFNYIYIILNYILLKKVLGSQICTIHSLSVLEVDLDIFVTFCKQKNKSIKINLNAKDEDIRLETQRRTGSVFAVKAFL